MDFEKLIEEAELTFGLASGTGLGAVLLAIVLIAIFGRTRLSGNALSSMLTALRKPK